MQNSTRFSQILNIVLLSLAVGVSHAASLGDPAPELHIAKWVKGDAVRVLSGGAENIYVVEFWATWCPPCRTSIPHLTDIQKRFKDKKVVVIGVSDEAEKTVKPFVDKMGGKMEYRVAIDEGGKTGADYMKAYGINGIPHAFVVQNRKVIWQGHPMAGLDQALDEITAGKYDLAKSKRRADAEAAYEQFREAIGSGEDAKADALSEKLIAAGKEGLIPEFYPAKEKKELRSSALLNQFRTALLNNDNKKAEEFSKRLEAVNPDVKLEEIRSEVEARKLASKYFSLATSESSAEKREQTGSQLAAKLKGQPDLGNNVAWSLLTQKAVIHHDNDLALQIAKQACEDSQWKHAGSIDTYARALFVSGKREEAIQYQQKAIAAADDGEKSELQATLQSYQAGKLPAAE